MITVASEHKRKALERHFKEVKKEEDKRKALEEYFKKPYDTINPEIYKDLTFIHTIVSPDGKYKLKKEHYFYDGNYGSRHLPLEEIQQD